MNTRVWHVVGVLVILVGSLLAFSDAQHLKAQAVSAPVVFTNMPTQAGQVVSLPLPQYPSLQLQIARLSANSVCLHTEHDRACFEAVNVDRVEVSYGYEIFGEVNLTVLVRRDIQLQTEGLQEVLSSLMGNDTRAVLTLDLVLGLVGDDITGSVRSVIQAPDVECLIALNSQDITCW